MQEKEVKKKKFSHKELKKSRIKKKMIRISVIYSCIFLGAIVLTVLLINILPSYRIYSDENTISVEGKVVEVSSEKIDMRSSGRGSRGHIVINVYLMLDSGEEYEITDYEYREYCEYSVDEFKSLILNQEVKIRTDKWLKHRAVKLETDERIYAPYEATNALHSNWRFWQLVIAALALLVVVMLYIVELNVLHGEYKFCSI